MIICTIKDKATGKILWSGFQALSGLVMIAPMSPDIGFPTIYIGWDEFIWAWRDSPDVFISWTKVDTE